MRTYIIVACLLCTPALAEQRKPAYDTGYYDSDVRVEKRPAYDNAIYGGHITQEKPVSPKPQYDDYTYSGGFTRGTPYGDRVPQPKR